MSGSILDQQAGEPEEAFKWVLQEHVKLTDDKIKTLIDRVGVTKIEDILEVRDDENGADL